jgi:hypothetical protein
MSDMRKSVLSSSEFTSLAVVTELWEASEKSEGGAKPGGGAGRLDVPSLDWDGSTVGGSPVGPGGFGGLSASALGVSKLRPPVSLSFSAELPKKEGGFW